MNEFNNGDLVKVRPGFGTDAGQLRIITDYDEATGRYHSLKATSKGNIDKRSSEWVFKCEAKRLELVKRKGSGQ